MTEVTKKKINFDGFMKMKAEGEKIVMLTAYDSFSAQAAEKAGVDILLVGDSLGNVVLGYDNTLPVTMEDMICHAKTVVRKAPKTNVIVDLPFGSFEVSTEQAIANSIRMIKETGCDGVKIEGGSERAHLIRAISAAGIPVVAHIGLTPQLIMQLGGFKAQGKSLAAAQKILNDALAVEEAGARMVVLECVPANLAKLVSERVNIPTIGIGAGAGCDGQVLVWYDLAGMYDGFKPKFVKRFVEAGELITGAFAEYTQEVKAGTFPGPEHNFAANFSDEDLEKL